MIDIYGTDIKNDFSFSNGDLNIVTGTSNLGQAIVNRLNADLDTYDMFYARYGGELFEHIGDLNNPNIHEYIRIEIEEILSQEPRIQTVECTVNKTDAKTVKCNLKVTTIQSNEVAEFNLVINQDSYIGIDGQIAFIPDDRSD